MKCDEQCNFILWGCIAARDYVFRIACGKSRGAQWEVDCVDACRHEVVKLPGLVIIRISKANYLLKFLFDSLGTFSLRGVNHPCETSRKLVQGRKCTQHNVGLRSFFL